MIGAKNTRMPILFVVFLYVFLTAVCIPRTVHGATNNRAFVTIINQVRGESCCSPGNLENTRAQLENAVKYELPTMFVLRYDALTDARYTDLILSYQRLHPTLIQTGVMVEIVPTLIQSTNVQFSISKTKCGKSTEGVNERDSSSTNSLGMTGESGSPIPTSPNASSRRGESGMTTKDGLGLEGQRAISAAEMSEEPDNNKVPDEFLREEIECCPEITCGIQYIGTSETWFQAQNAFTIGYSRDARTVIIDTLLAKYQKVFGTYPKVSSAWMIDTDSVNYLHDKYGITTHQITREQWGTDSYTLYGGPPHYPYPASRNWIMNPGFSVDKPVTIVRQTVTDPLYNYGDTSSSYTSQPNDYMRGARDIEYFKTLIDNAIRQKSIGFANVGLENSMDGQYQDEYALQLAYIAKLKSENKLAVVFPDAIGGVFQFQKITTYARTDGDRQAIWITTPNYRMRVIRNKQEVSITDLRIYSEEIKDPYSSSVAKHEGYWVVPFLVDGSRWYAWKDMDKSPHKFIPISTDLFSNPTRIVLATNVETISITQRNDAVFINDSENQNIVDFYEDSFNLPNNLYYKSSLPYQFPVTLNSRGDFTWNVDGKTSWEIRKTKCSRLCSYNISMNTTLFPDVLSQQYPYVYPESVGRTLSDTYTRVSVNNTFALAGRNPVRLVLEPHDAMNFPIILDEEARITVDPDHTAVTRLGKLVSSQQQYVDLDRSDAHKVFVNVTMNQKGKIFSVSKTVYFAPNCKKDWGYCVAHPIQGTWYMLTKLTDWWSGRK
jgi:hypothetical protein